MVDGADVRLSSVDGELELFATRPWEPGEILLWLSGELMPLDVHSCWVECNRVSIAEQPYSMARYEPTEYGHIRSEDDAHLRNLEEDLIQDNGLFFVKLRVCEPVGAGDVWVKS